MGGVFAAVGVAPVFELQIDSRAGVRNPEPTALLHTHPVGSRGSPSHYRDHDHRHHHLQQQQPPRGSNRAPLIPCRSLLPTLFFSLGRKMRQLEHSHLRKKSREENRYSGRCICPGSARGSDIRWSPSSTGSRPYMRTHAPVTGGKLLLLRGSYRGRVGSVWQLCGGARSSSSGWTGSAE